MTETYLNDAELAALGGTTDPEQDVLFVPTGESPYYLSFYKMLYRLLDVARRAGDLRVYKDGPLTFGARAGKFMDGATIRIYAGATAQVLTNNSDNYIYLTAGAVLCVNTSGWPDPAATPHLPLAIVTTAAGDYAHSDITDHRGRSMFGLITGETPELQLEAGQFFAATDITAAQAETLSDGSNADGLHRHGAAGLEAACVTAAKLGYAPDSMVIVPRATTDLLTGANLQALYAAYRTTPPTPGGQALSQTNPFFIGYFGNLRLAKTGANPGLLRDIEHIHLVNLGAPGAEIYSYASDGIGPTLRDTALDASLLGVQLGAHPNGTTATGCRCHELVNTIVTTGTGATNARISTTITQLSKAGVDWVTLGVQVDDAVEMSGGSVTTHRSWRVTSLDEADADNFPGVYDLMTIVGFQADTGGLAAVVPENSSENVAYTVRRYNRLSVYEDVTYNRTCTEPIIPGGDVISTNGHIGGTWRRCKGTPTAGAIGGYSWRVAKYCNLLGLWEDCRAGDFSWAGDGGALIGDAYTGGTHAVDDPGFAGTHDDNWVSISAAMRRCRGTLCCFGGCANFGGHITRESVLEDNTGGNSSFALGRKMEGYSYRNRGGSNCFAGRGGSHATTNTFAAVAEDCHATGDSFGAGESASANSGGSMLRCSCLGLVHSIRLTNASVRHTDITQATTDTDALVLNDGNTEIYHSLIIAKGTGIAVNDDGTARNVKIAHCTLGPATGAGTPATGLGANVTNLITTPNNVCDANVTV